MGNFDFNNIIAEINLIASRFAALGIRVFTIYKGLEPLIDRAPYGPCSEHADALKWLENRTGAFVNQTCIEYQDRERCWYTYVSERAVSRRNNVPLIVDLHGAGGCASLPSLGSGTIVDTAGLVVAWPQGIKKPLPYVPWIIPELILDVLGLSVTSWNDGTGLFGAELAGVDDVGFLEIMIAEILARSNPDYGVNIARARIYMIGHSNGATMAQRFALQSEPGVLAGVVAISGSGMPQDPMWVPGGEVSDNYRSTSIALVAGSKDKVVPFGERRGPLAGAMASFDGWARLNDCEDDSRFIYDFEYYRKYIYTDCRDGNEVVLYEVKGQGHHPFKKGIEAFQIASLNTIPECPFRGIPTFSECDCALSTKVDSTAMAWEFIVQFAS
ncbi:depolymerase [Seminavis robusta]|uniref:Depolymerase n=1 Tax=Seminavis robusta TaxID=568900 RepID=A0A9N8HPR2_9STRA|nr:depolymerase [Seminavis robusta]|eukprot:Sro1095_g240630.1 depolymerase (385) ;mRNA; f:5134-6372